MNKSIKPKKENDLSSEVNEEFSDGSASAFEGTEITDDTANDEDKSTEKEKTVSPKKDSKDKKDKETYY